MVEKYQFGLMQGRLLPRYKNRYQAFPVGYWEAEFYMAKTLGFDFIEWILDYNDAHLNPLLANLEDIKFICKDSNVGVRSVCADYFMEAPLHGPDFEKSQSILKQIIKNCKELNIQDIIIPCVDQSSLTSELEITTFIKHITPSLRLAEELNIYINLETDLAPEPFLKLITQLNSPCIRVNYDSGNSSSLGYDIHKEFNTYGDLISVFHVKDRPFKDGSVLLGTGDVNFDIVSHLLYQNPHIEKITLQAYRYQDYLKDVNGVKEQFDFFQNKLKGVLV